MNEYWSCRHQRQTTLSMSIYYLNARATDICVPGHILKVYIDFIKSYLLFYYRQI